MNSNPFMFCSRYAAAKAKWLLLLYQGGGYDGCFWEWNSCLLGKEEDDFHELVTTGYKGIRDRNLALAWFRDAKKGKAYTSDFYVVDVLAKPEVWKKVDIEFSPHFLGETYYILNETGIKTTAGLFCDVCGVFIGADAVSDPEYMRFTDACCDGGVHMSYRGKVCSRCWDLGKCWVCDSIGGDDDAYIGVDNLKHGMCRYHEHMAIVKDIQRIKPEHMGVYEWLRQESCLADEDWYEIYRLDKRHGGWIEKVIRELWNLYQDIGDDLFVKADVESPNQPLLPGV